MNQTGKEREMTGTEREMTDTETDTHSLTTHSFVQVRHFCLVRHHTSDVEMHPVVVADKLLQPQRQSEMTEPRSL